MSAHDFYKSHILISTQFEVEFKNYREELKPFRVVGFLEDEFKIEHAKAVISEAYLSETNKKYIILAANSFNNISQNSLLKVLEEPPENIHFIIISPSKSLLLPTLRSRLPIVKGKTPMSDLTLSINLTKIDYSEVFEFLKEHSRMKKSDAKLLLEALYRRATIKDKLILTSSQLDNFDKAYRLLELNSRPQSVFAMILMSFVRER